MSQVSHKEVVKAYLRGYYAGLNDRSEVKADWVSVDDELPTDDDCYLIAWIPKFGHLPQSMKHYYAISDYDPVYGWSKTTAMLDNGCVILAWMSLPGWYEEEEDD